MKKPKINVTIPTYNRASCVRKAVDAALDQSYDNYAVTVVDNASTDDTYDVLRPYFDHPRLCYLRLRSNVGTAQAKNVSLLASPFEAITFHDSDDVPSDHKLLLQVRALCQPGHVADEILDWGSIGREPGCGMDVDVVVGAHKLIRLDGSVYVIDKRMSLVDDYFPNLQFPSQTEGDWILINSGLFRRRVFEEVGGYLDSVEEDRELRNRTIACGYLYYYIREPLLTKIETDGSLTTDEETGYRADRRIRDRREVWRRTQHMRQATDREALKREMQTTIDLSGVAIDFVSNPALLSLNETVPATDASKAVIAEALSVQVAA